MRQGDRGDGIVRARRHVHDHVVDVAQRRLQGRRGADGQGDRLGAPNQIGQAGRPDEIIREDRDPGGQSSVSAR
jgi:hypothetical protein